MKIEKTTFFEITFKRSPRMRKIVIRTEKAEKSPVAAAQENEELKKSYKTEKTINLTRNHSFFSCCVVRSDNK